MDALKLKNATRKDVGASQGFVPLDLRDGIVKDSGSGGRYLSLTCAFKPTSQELSDMLNPHLVDYLNSIDYDFAELGQHGAPVILTVLTGEYDPDVREQKLGRWPPVALYVDPNEKVE